MFLKAARLRRFACGANVCRENGVVNRVPPRLVIETLI
jgi:hypothetical protein